MTRMPLHTCADAAGSAFAFAFDETERTTSPARLVWIIAGVAGFTVLAFALI